MILELILVIAGVVDLNSLHDIVYLEECALAPDFK